MINRNRIRPVLSDPEVMELLADSPELLAIADAISATRPKVARPRRRTFGWRPLGMATGAVVAVALIATVLPLRGNGGGFVAQALAAVSDGQTLHVLMAAPSQGDTVVNLKSGRRVQPQVTLEVWFDESSGRMRLEVRKNGALEYTGASAYPLGGGLRATLAAAGASPSLSVFVAGYRQALERGQVSELGAGSVAGHEVKWLRVGEGVAAHVVAVDEQTKLPVLVRDAQGKTGWRLEQVDSEEAPLPAAGAAATVSPALDALAAKPAATPGAPVSGQVVKSKTATAAAASQALQGKLVAPTRAGGLVLDTVSVQTLTTSFSDGHKERSVGVELRYHGQGREVRVQEALQPEPAYRFVEPDRTFGFDPLPATGQLVLAKLPSVVGGQPTWIGQMRLPDGLYLTLTGHTDRPLVALARILATG